MAPLPSSLQQVEGVPGDKLLVHQIFESSLAEVTHAKTGVTGFVRSKDIKIETDAPSISKKELDDLRHEGSSRFATDNRFIAQYEAKIGSAIKEHVVLLECGLIGYLYCKLSTI